MYVVLGSGPEAPTTLVWATKDTVMSAVLEAVPDDGPTASGSPASIRIGAGRVHEARGEADPEADGQGNEAPVARHSRSHQTA